MLKHLLLHVKPYHDQEHQEGDDDPDDSDGDRDGLLDAFDEMFLKVQFTPPATKQEYFEVQQYFFQKIFP